MKNKIITSTSSEKNGLHPKIQEPNKQEDKFILRGFGV